MSVNSDGFLFTFGPDDLSIGEHGLLKLLICVFKLSSIFLMRLGEVEFGIYIYIYIRGSDIFFASCSLDRALLISFSLKFILSDISIVTQPCYHLIGGLLSILSSSETHAALSRGPFTTLLVYLPM